MRWLEDVDRLCLQKIWHLDEQGGGEEEEEEEKETNH